MEPQFPRGTNEDFSLPLRGASLSRPPPGKSHDRARDTGTRRSEEAGVIGAGALMAE